MSRRYLSHFYYKRNMSATAKKNVTTIDSVTEALNRLDVSKNYNNEDLSGSSKINSATEALNRLAVSKNNNNEDLSSSSLFSKEDLKINREEYVGVDLGGLGISYARSGFSIFEKVVDLGHFSWSPRGKYRKLEKSNTKDILSMIRYPASPDTLMDLGEIRKQLPLKFVQPPSQKHLNKYPFDLPHIASLHVVASYLQDTVDVQDIDFVLGGSGLEVLATETIQKGNTYVCCWVPHTNVIIFKKHKIYPQELADVGFQFERLVTGKAMGDRHDLTQIEHLQLCQVGKKFSILFSAEVDAKNNGNNNERVEIKTSKPQNWGTKTMFQMISSGSSYLCHGKKGKGGKPPTLTGVDLLSLETVAKRALQKSKRSVSQLEDNIVRHLTTIQSKMKQLEQGKVYKIRFSSSSSSSSSSPEGGEGQVEIDLSLANGTDLIPSSEVIQELITTSNKQ